MCCQGVVVSRRASQVPGQCQPFTFCLGLRFGSQVSKEKVVAKSFTNDGSHLKSYSLSFVPYPLWVRTRVS